MPVFHYKGIDAASKSIKGIVDAESEKAARAKLRKQRIYPTHLKAETSKSGGGKRFSSSVSGKDIAHMTRQLAILLNANIPLVEALAAVQDQVDHPLLRQALADIKEKVSEGTRFWEAMRAYPRIFDTIFVNMVKAGESSGSLELILTRLADYKEDQVELMSKVQTAMIYPVIMITISLGMMVFLFGFVLPEMARLFEKQRIALPTITQIVLSLSHFLTDHWLAILIFVTAGIVLFRIYKNSANGRRRLDNYKLTMPIFGVVTQKVVVARLSRTLSTLLSSGVQLLQGLEIVRDILNNVVLAEVINPAIASVKEGESLSDTLKQSGRFPNMFIHMLAIGERTGMLENMLSKIADTYALETKNAIANMTAVINPVMVIFMAIIVVIVVVSVMLPIMSMSTAL